MQRQFLTFSVIFLTFPSKALTWDEGPASLARAPSEDAARRSAAASRTTWASRATQHRQVYSFRHTRKHLRRIRKLRGVDKVADTTDGREAVRIEQARSTGQSWRLRL